MPNFEHFDAELNQKTYYNRYDDQNEGEFLRDYECVANIKLKPCLDYCTSRPSCVAVEYNPVFGDRRNVCCPYKTIGKFAPRTHNYRTGRFYVKNTSNTAETENDDTKIHLKQNILSKNILYQCGLEAPIPKNPQPCRSTQVPPNYSYPEETPEEEQENSTNPPQEVPTTPTTTTTTTSPTNPTLTNPTNPTNSTPTNPTKLPIQEAPTTPTSPTKLPIQEAPTSPTAPSKQPSTTSPKTPVQKTPAKSTLSHHIKQLRSSGFDGLSWCFSCCILACWLIAIFLLILVNLVE